MIELKAVSKRFTSGRGHVAALSGITLSCTRGQELILAGRSGSGKTTLLNCLGTLEVPDSGTIFINGVNLRTLNTQQRTRLRSKEIGFVFQNGNLLPWLTVAENLRFPLELNKIQKKAQAKRIEELLTTFGLQGYNKALPLELSGGEAQRVAFARAIAHSPPLLLADEPTASLDSQNSRQLIELMFSLCKRNRTTLIIATHDQDILAMASNVVFLKDGKLENSL